MENNGNGRTVSNTWNNVLNGIQTGYINIIEKYKQYLVFRPTRIWKCKATTASRAGMIGTTIFSRTWFAAGCLNQILIEHK